MKAAASYRFHILLPHEPFSHALACRPRSVEVLQNAFCTMELHSSAPLASATIYPLEQHSHVLMGLYGDVHSHMEYFK